MSCTAAKGSKQRCDLGVGGGLTTHTRSHGTQWGRGVERVRTCTLRSDMEELRVGEGCQAVPRMPVGEGFGQGDYSLTARPPGKGPSLRLPDSDTQSVLATSWRRVPAPLRKTAIRDQSWPHHDGVCRRPSTSRRKVKSGEEGPAPSAGRAAAAHFLMDHPRLGCRPPVKKCQWRSSGAHVLPPAYVAAQATHPDAAEHSRSQVYALSAGTVARSSSLSNELCE